MDIFSSLTSLVTGYLQAKAIKGIGKDVGDYIDNWFKLIASVLITIIVVFPGIWGMITLGIWMKYGIWISLGVGFATSLMTTALTVYILWTRNPLTKGIAIAVPSILAQKALEEDVTITQRS